jgi:ADP-dependent NAD(P)H-hydrate dehydratase / NAD(P)H-hydrate epimerase
MKLVTVAEMRAIEQAADAGGVTYAMMMERAGKGLAKLVLEDFADPAGPRSALALVGSGNNGGDALVALAALAEAGWQVRAYLVAARPEKDPLLAPFAEAQIKQAAEDRGLKQLGKWVGEAQVILDGVLGTGARLPLKGEIAKVLGHVSSLPELPYVVAVDCPSGVDCDRGAVAEETIPADLTVCMQAVKTGLLRFPAYAKVGGLEVVDLDLPEDLADWQGVKWEVANDTRVSALLPERGMQSHKGTFGTALVVAGSLNYTGAAYLASRAAYLSGAGLVQAAIPASLHPALAGQLPEVTWVLLPHELGVVAETAAEILLDSLERATAMLVGPGFGLEKTSGAFIKRLLEGQTSHGRRSGISFLDKEPVPGAASGPKKLPPLVLDADGLKLLAKNAEWWKLLPPDSILTPHPGEMALLTDKPVAELQADRLQTALHYAAAWGQVVILKGALTVVAAPDGRAGVVPVATAALARAGTGDVLAGIVTGLRAQGLPAYEAALAGAYIHAQAGLSALMNIGAAASVLAGDVLEAIPEVLASLGD